jgi:phosphoglycerol transferase MdoB-like AlkP superfamily enzyme
LPETPAPAPARPADAALNTGLGRLLLFVYGVFALSASARASVQIITHFSEAPLAYLLSALAGLVYIAATVGLAVGGTRGRRIALAGCSVEMLGVLIVGTLSIADKIAFPDDTVWSRYGSGYGYVPLVLPFIGLWWVWQHRARKS